MAMPHAESGPAGLPQGRPQGVPLGVPQVVAPQQVTLTLITATQYQGIVDTLPVMIWMYSHFSGSNRGAGGGVFLIFAFLDFICF